MSRIAKLKEMTTVGEVLDTVMEHDMEAHAFYVGLAPSVSKSIRYIVEDLARAELDHVNLLRELAKQEKVAGHLRDAIRRPQADAQFSDAFHDVDLGDNPDDQAVLQFALAREQEAIEEYAELAAHTPPGLMHEIFAFLANEEAKHKAELEKTYYEIVHAGGV
jgi:rubrerythrin